ncbi:hypothetical protein BO94DRAFT_325694 [Aspergillus sclerotioniger CBS 115572]|uniref:Uncharacterized protein n=1 Tax=Aspergillus sclerotioniger CBS 115572 TaxID=1450535 RepID=A0A317XB98_9EURO|nr:hypothetical protein BO94DRAFT_325694 [Aspergillus sclerotioniger CBS 115572]PWY94238.1 hypothetical protein BO94DRAFT_325694 [Aspergillus sclerotioniger CBS 115572]
MYVIIICATLPTLRQSYIVVLHRTRQTASYYTHSLSIQKPRPISFPRRMPDASLFETGVDGTGLANVASPGNTGQNDTAITKTTEIEVLEESNIGKDPENPHFPREDPFRFGSYKL